MLGVVKIGGAAGNKLDTLVKELAKRTTSGERWVLVHGASGIMDKLCAERGIEVKMITSPSGYRSRYVGDKEREVFREAALSYGAGIKQALQSSGAKAEQIDPEVIRSVSAKRKDVIRESVNGRIRILRGNYSGTVSRIDGTKITAALDSGVIPIMPPLGLDDESGLSLNIDGDRLAAAVAGEIKADTLVILSNIPGLMTNIDDPNSLIRTASSVNGWDVLEHYAKGNMKRKLTACHEALELKVPNIYLADGRVDTPIANAIGGNATCLTR